MLAKGLTCAAVGLGGKLVQVGVDIARQGLPSFLIVGLPDDAGGRRASGYARPSRTAAWSSRTGIATYVEHSILDEGVIHALAEAAALSQTDR